MPNLPEHAAWLCAGFLVCAVTGCGSKQMEPVPLSPLSRDAVILSYLAGMNELTELYQDRGLKQTMQEVLGRRVVHGGKQAELSKDALQRLPAVLDKVKPDLMILGYGLTDLQRRHGSDPLKENLRGMITVARERGVEVVMVAMPRADLTMKPAKLYEELTQELAVPTEGRIAFEVLRTRSLKAEKFTLNDAGLKRFSEAIRALLVAEGALPADS